MHPIEVMELLLVGFILLFLVIISAFVMFKTKGKWRTITQSLVILYIVSVSIFYLVRPTYIEAQQLQKIDMLNEYFEIKYPGEEWKISAIPFRTEGYEHRGHYVFDVIFENEPDVTYSYTISSKKEVTLTSFSHIDGKETYLHIIE